MLPIFLITIFVLQQSKVHCQQRSFSIHTCCRLQSSLDPLGFCEQPISEFDLHTFPPRWKVPGVLINRINSQLVTDLQPKPMWCGCGRHSKIPITLSKSTNSKDEWVATNSETINSFLTPEGQLFSNGKEYEKDRYCLNKLSEIDNYRQRPDELDIELVICSESCAFTDTGMTGSIIPSKMKTNFVTETEDCLDSLDELKGYSDILKPDINSTESKGCNWAVFYIANDDLVLVHQNGNFTPILDKTYPWAKLPKDTYCKIGTEKGDMTFIKFCLTEIKKLFYGYQEFYAILAGVSAMFLLFNLAIYFALRESLSISGWTEFLYSSALYIYCVLSIPGLLIVPDNIEIRPTCYALSVLIQFFELASGATLVALSFDIFWTFCKFDKGNYTDDPQVSKFRISIYFIFSLAFPLAVVCYGISKNHRPWDFKFEDHSGVPQYGLLHCTAPDWPMASYTQFSMQGVNLLFALISAYTILNKNIRPLHDEDTERSLDPDRMDIFAKLFIFVFLFWIVNFMQYFLHSELFTTKWYLITFKAINYSQGIFAFFILVCNRRTLWGIRRKDWSLLNLFQHACCTCTRPGKRGDSDNYDAEAELPLSPLMKTGSFRRSTVRGNAFY